MRHSSANASTIGGTAIIQTVLLVKKKRGRRAGQKISATIVQDRTKETLLANIKKAVKRGTPIETDGLRSYRCLSSAGYPHESVEDKHAFVRHTGRKKIHTNTIESAHSQMKRNARKMNLLSGQMLGPGLEEKVGELVFRYNHRGNGICFSLSSVSCCSSTSVVARTMCDSSC